MKKLIFLVLLILLPMLLSAQDFVMPMKEFGISSGFGYRTDPLGGMEYPAFHKGIDLVGPENAPIFAIASGIVKEHWLPPGQLPGYKGHDFYGGMIVIDHGNGMFSLYAHMSITYVHEGDYIVKGKRIGLQGKTGPVTGEHLHLEILIDPLFILMGDVRIIQSFGRFWQKELYGENGDR